MKLSSSALFLEPSSEVKDFLDLLKPRVMGLVVFTSIVGLLLAPETIHPVLSIIAIFCIAIAAGAAGAINMWYDRDIDEVMYRTKDRPIPAGKIRSEEALLFGIVLSVLSVLLMFAATNALAAILLLGSILFYVFIYTIWLKRRTPQNIVIGGAAGAFPPVIGWAAATGEMPLEAWALFLIIFLWTPPHFWALSLYCRKDYERANVPMLPVVKGEAITRNQIVVYTCLLVISTVVPFYFETLSYLYLTTAMLLGVVFIYLTVKLKLKKDHASAKKLFLYSILYLFILFLSMGIDNFLL